MKKFIVILFGIVALSGCQQQSPLGETAVLTKDFLSDAERVELRLPAKGKLTLSTDADLKNVSALAPAVGSAVGAFLKPKNVKWQIVAARYLDKHILLWISFPEIADGGVDLIYSVEKDKIVGEFLGGYRG